MYSYTLHRIASLNSQEEKDAPLLELTAAELQGIYSYLILAGAARIPIAHEIKSTDTSLPTDSKSREIEPKYFTAVSRPREFYQSWMRKYIRPLLWKVPNSSFINDCTPANREGCLAISLGKLTGNTLLLDVCTDDMDMYMKGFLFLESISATNTSVYVHTLNNKATPTEWVFTCAMMGFPFTILPPEIQVMIISYNASSWIRVSKSSYCETRHMIVRDPMYTAGDKLSCMRLMLESKRDLLDAEREFINNVIDIVQPFALRQPLIVRDLHYEEVMDHFTKRMSVYARNDLLYLALSNKEYLKHLLTEEDDFSNIIKGIGFNQILNEGSTTSTSEYFRTSKAEMSNRKVMLSSFLYLLKRAKNPNIDEIIERVEFLPPRLMVKYIDYLDKSLIPSWKDKRESIINEGIHQLLDDRKYEGAWKLIQKTSEPDIPGILRILHSWLDIGLYEPYYHAILENVLSNASSNIKWDAVLDTINEMIKTCLCSWDESNYWFNIRILCILISQPITKLTRKRLGMICKLQRQYSNTPEYHHLLETIINNPNIRYSKFKGIYDSYTL